MSEVQIDRLTLQVRGLTEADGRRLALRVADGLGAAAAAGGGRDIPSLRLDLVAKPNAGPNALARQVVAELLQLFQRLP